MSVQSDIQGAYVAFFNRPADYLGLQYWTEQVESNGGSLAAVIDAFSASSEYTSLYSGLSTAQIVTTIYSHLFGRAAEPDAIAYWGTRLDNGTFTVGDIAYSIFVGAQNADLATIQNKVTVAVEFTNALDTTAEITGYSTADAAETARTYLSAVTSDAGTVTTARANLDATLTTIVGGQTNGGTSIVLTSALDALSGTSGNDSFVGDNTSTTFPTVNAGDTINGGAGIDSFTFFAAGATPVLPTLTSIETLVLASPGAAVTLDTSSVAGLQTVTLSQGVTGSTITVAAGVGVGLDRTGNYATGTAVATETFVTANSQKSQALAISGASNVNSVALNGTGLTAISIASTGTSENHIGTLTTNSTVVDTLTLTGGAKLSINTLQDASTIKTIDASATTGGVTLFVGATDTTVKGGSGDDLFSFDNNLNTADKVDGGAGTDTVVILPADITSAGNATLKALNAMTNVEVVAFFNFTSHVSGDTFTNTQVNKFVFDTSGADIVDSATDITYSAVGHLYVYNDATGNQGDLTLNEKAGVSTAHIAMEGTKVTGANGAALIGTLAVNLNANDLAANPNLVSTVDIVSTGFAGASANAITAITAQAGSTVVLTGSQDLTVGALTNKATFNASAFTGKLTITGSAGQDSIVGGSAADTVNATAGGDTYTGGAGADKFVFTAATQGSNTALTTIADFVSGTDKLDLSALSVGAPTAIATTAVDVSSAADFQSALNIAAAGNGGVTAVENYFQFQGNTYVVVDNSAGATFVAGTDAAIKLAGLVTLTATDVIA